MKALILSSRKKVSYICIEEILIVLEMFYNLGGKGLFSGH